MSISESDPQAQFPMLKEIPVQILNLKDGDCLIIRLPPQAFVEMTDSGRTGASDLEREFMNWFQYKNKEIKVKALPFSVELAIIEGEKNGND